MLHVIYLIWKHSVIKISMTLCGCVANILTNYYIHTKLFFMN